MYHSSPFLVDCMGCSSHNEPVETDTRKATSRNGSVRKFDSPLRYPGGKASIAGFLAETIKINDQVGCSYVEPFAGGAGAALRLLREEVVSELHLNDLDPHISSFWRAALGESERFAEAVLTVPLSIEEWRRQQSICRLADPTKTFDLGFATFYLNRCNRSGIIVGAAPIGGYSQSGEWRLDARFYRETLAERILAIGEKRDQIHITNMDALDFLTEHIAGTAEETREFIYLDPPYYSYGKRLYMNSYSNHDHEELAKFVQGRETVQWVMSYDNSDFVKSLYANCNLSLLPLRYSLQRIRNAAELLIAPFHVLLPSPDVLVGPQRGEPHAIQSGLKL